MWMNGFASRSYRHGRGRPLSLPACLLVGSAVAALIALTLILQG